MSTSGDVQMGKVPAKDIEAGTTSNVQTTISITNCPANVGIALTASDVATPGNTSNILTLKDASDPSVAKGVGISFSYGDDNTPITLGQAKRVIANTVEGTQPAIALKARYVKNGPGTVTAGRANAQATLTLSYQ
jgi:type 1 fimbria pilin